MQHLEHAWYQETTGLEQQCTNVFSCLAQTVVKPSGFLVNMCILAFRTVQ